MRAFLVKLSGLSMLLGLMASSPACLAQSVNLTQPSSTAETSATEISPTPTVGGLTAGTFLLRGRVIGIIPEDNNSTITRIHGQIKVDATASPEIDLSYFATDHIAIEGEAGALHTSISAQNTALGDVSIGKLWSVPVTLVLQYHVLPHRRFNPYFGAGMVVTSYFGEQPAGGLVQSVSVDTQVGAVLEAGVDYQISGRWYANIDIKQLFIAAEAHINNREIDARNDLDPLVIGAGIGYRF